MPNITEKKHNTTALYFLLSFIALNKSLSFIQFQGEVDLEVNDRGWALTLRDGGNAALVDRRAGYARRTM